MAFNQQGLSKVFSQSRDISDGYVYKTADEFNTVTAAGYFDAAGTARGFDLSGALIWVHGPDRVYLLTLDGEGNPDTSIMSGHGWQDFADSTTATTPITVDVGGGTVQLTNDNGGTLTDGNTTVNATTTMLGTNDIWSTGINGFSYAGTGTKKNDYHVLRIHLGVTAGVVPLSQSLKMTFFTTADLSGGEAFSFSFKLPEITVGAGVEQEYIEEVPYFVGESIVNGSAKLEYIADTAADVRVVGWNIGMFRK